MPHKIFNGIRKNNDRIFSDCIRLYPALTKSLWCHILFWQLMTEF